LDEAIQIKSSLGRNRAAKNEAFTYWERAIARVYAGLLEQSAADLEAAAKLDPDCAAASASTMGRNLPLA
jgi:hypothetical protein